MADAMLGQHTISLRLNEDSAMDLMLAKRRSLVTGGSRGIGLGIVRELAVEGASVIFCGRDVATGTKIQNEFRSLNYDVTFVAGDVTSEQGVSEVAAQVLASGPIDILVNNVGGAHDPEAGARSFEDIPVRDWIGTFQKCLFNATQMTALLVGPMRSAGWGRIINISSTSGLEPESSPCDYAAAKAAVNTMTVSLAGSLAKTGVTANVVAPGPVLTDSIQAYMDWVAAHRGWDVGPEGLEAQFLSEVLPVKTSRMGRPDDIGAAVAFLASPRADYITGAHLRVDGGLSHAAI